MDTRGVFTWRLCRRAGDVTDGLSNTLLMAEVERGGSSPRQVRGRQMASVAGVGSNPSLCLAQVSGGRYVADSGAGPAGYNWAHGAQDLNCFHTVLPPNSPSCSDGSGSFSFTSASSSHTGGAQVLLGDGSVRFVSDSIDAGDPTAAPVTAGKSPYGVWGALGSRSGGEPTGDF